MLHFEGGYEFGVVLLQAMPGVYGLWSVVWIMCANRKFKFTKSSPGAFLPVGDSGQAIIFTFALPAVGADITFGNFYSVVPPPIIGDHKRSAEMAIYMASAAKWAKFPERVRKFKILPPAMGACLPSKPIVRCPIGLEV
ncbi:hypothetical protein [Pseudomonas sp. NPDC079086]|uniref:hypothetical protein n=1 Tax=Pseudomonas sp. NPDC079086 TaxID=3364427 RepID=UPI0037C9FDC8